MASKKVRGITVEIGGDTSKLGDALKDTEAKTSSLHGELREVERALKFNPDNVELLAQKQKILTETVKETTEKLEILKKAEEQVVKQFENKEIGEEEFRAFQREIIETESKLAHFESKLDDTGDGVKDLGDKAEESGDGFTVMKGALADLVSDAIQGAISAIGDLVGELFELSEATEEYRTMQAKLEGSATTFGYTMDFASSQYEKFYKYLGDDQMATNAITNLMGLGLETENVSALAEASIAVWSAYGDSIPIESLTESINETAQVGKVTGNLADALNWAGISEDEFNAKLEKCTTTQERADLIAQTLNGTYGESKQKYDELNQSVTEANEAELALKDTQAKLGETMAPVNNALTTLKNEALKAIVPLVESFATALLNTLTWLKEHPVALQIITTLVIALATAFGILAGALAIQGIINGVAIAVAFLNTTLLANPIVLIVALIAGLVAGFIYLWNTCDEFRQFWIDLWEGIKTIFSAVVNGIVDFFKNNWQSILLCMVNPFAGAFKLLYDNFGGFREFVDKTIDNIKNLFVNCRDGIMDTFANIGSWFATTFGGAWDAVKNVFSGWGSFFSGLWSKISSTFSNIGTNISNAISGAVKSGLNGVISAIERTINSGIGLINGAISLINELPGVSVGKLKTLSLPRLAKGGIVDKPTIAEIGEDGREAIVPLENNTGWIRGVARELNQNLTPTTAIDNAEVLQKLDGIYERLGRLQMVTDTGALVGEMLDQIDTGLAYRQVLSARGV